MDNYLQVANSPMMWLMVTPAIVVVFLQVFLISKKAIASGPIVGLSKKESYTALKTGFVSGMGPASAVFIVMMSMTTVIGAPVTWLRTVIIGAASTELTASQFGADVLNVPFGGEGYGLTAFCCSILLMVLNGTGWLLFCALFTDKLGKLTQKVTGDDTALLGAISGAAMVGAMSYMVAGHLIAMGGRFAAAVASGLAMVVLVKIADKKPALSEHTLGIAMVIGMIVGAIVQ